jgi:hypothetical protein
MKYLLSLGLSLGAMLFATLSPTHAQAPESHPTTATSSVVTVGELVTEVRQKAKALESSVGMRSGLQALIAAHGITPNSIRYPDYVVVRLLYEATRDAGFWNVHWQITDQPPNSDRIWRQWSAADRPSMIEPTAIAECDELSALFSFLVQRAGVRNVGLFWPFPNHTVAVWTVRPTDGKVVRVVVPTSQIFLEANDDFDTKKFNPWRQKTIYEYTLRDVADSFEIPKPLADFFLQQIDKYAAASDATLQRIRYFRDAVIGKAWTPGQAASEALKLRATLISTSSEVAAALQTFADDMREAALRR